VPDTTVSCLVQFENLIIDDIVFGITQFALRHCLIRTGFKLNQAGDGVSGTLSPNAQLLLSKLAVSHFNGLTAAKLMPAAIELSNLAGTGSGNANVG